jgi:hypothetical protein
MGAVVAKKSKTAERKRKRENKKHQEDNPPK